MNSRISFMVMLGLVAGATAVMLAGCGGKTVTAPPTVEPLAAAPTPTPTVAPPAPIETPRPVPAVSAPKPTPETPKPVPAPAPPKPVKEPDHIFNGSFELADKKGAPEFWSSDDPKAARDAKAHSGDFSIKLHPSTKKTVTRRLRCTIENGQTLLGKHITVKAMTTARMKGKPDPKAPLPFAMHVQYVVDGKEEEFYHLFPGGKDWNEAVVAGVIPEKADPKSLRLAIGVRPSAVDPVLIDDVTLTVD